MDLWNELELKRKQLLDAIKDYEKRGEDLGYLEKEYRIVLRKETLKLKDQMAVTLIPYVVKGIDEVARAGFARDVAEAQYKAAQELINAIKLEMRVIESQLNREWSMA